MIQPVLSEMFLAFNEWYGEQFDQMLARYDADQLDAAPDFTLETDSWFEQPVQIKDALTGLLLYTGRPDQWPGDSDSDAVIEWAYAAAALCDEALPMPVARRLRAVSNAPAKLLRQLLESDWHPLQTDYEDPASLALSRLLEAIAPDLSPADLQAILDRLLLEEQPDELVTAALKVVFMQHREVSLPILSQSLRDALQAGKAVTGSVEQVMILLAEVGAKGHSADDFAAMRDAFRRAEHKQIAAICLGDFQDPRGIVVLKAWLEGHPEADRATRLEIAASIKRLGGEIV